MIIDSKKNNGYEKLEMETNKKFNTSNNFIDQELIRASENDNSVNILNRGNNTP